MQGAVSGNANFDGSKDVVINTKQSNIAILTGDITSNGTDKTATKEISYPQNFNNKNCIVLSVMLELENSVINWGYGATFDSSSNVGANISKRVNLRENDIFLGIRQIYMGTSNNDSVLDFIVENLPKAIYHYKIVLLRTD